MRNGDVAAWKDSMGASSLGVFFVAVVAIGGLGGNWLDGRFHTSPLFAVLGVFIGMVAGIREMLKTLKQTPAPPAGLRPISYDDQNDDSDNQPTQARSALDSAHSVQARSVDSVDNATDSERKDGPARG